eukprot:TRINITY_DN11306_c0_g1_i1.p1 TRINITY_DN11306_c0_g1~~TRINITY_DN11306_c0_g1_i1.p1  ORF type:complete len:181 (+),score=14.31 TRINITY_DN11306_c0_g1_i1:134-676(+)
MPDGSAVEVRHPPDMQVDTNADDGVDVRACRAAIRLRPLDPPLQTQSASWRLQLDALSTTTTGLEVRLPRPGDTFHPSWREYPVKLTAFLRGQGIPLHHRDAVPILVAPKAGNGGEEMVAAVWPTHVAKPFHCGATTPATFIMRVREHSHTPIYPSNPSDPSDSDTDNEDATAEGLNASP